MKLRQLFLPAMLTAIFLLGLCAPLAVADEGPLDPSQPKGITADEIIKRFAAREKEFKEALEQYTYRQTVTVQTLDGNTVDGEFKEVFDVTFDAQGRRVKNMVFAPQSTLERVGMTQEDMDDIESRFPFVVSTDQLDDYSILYVGQQQEDDLHCHVFDLAPKKIEGKKRYFQDRIWVDDHDFQIVKSYGKSVPEKRSKKGKGGDENLFPKYTTYREQIDGKYWFPTYTRADDTLHFSNQDVHMRDIVKYTNYQQFGSKVKIIYEGQDISKTPDKPDSPQKPEPPAQQK